MDSTGDGSEGARLGEEIVWQPKGNGGGGVAAKGGEGGGEGQPKRWREGWLGLGKWRPPLGPQMGRPTMARLPRPKPTIQNSQEFLNFSLIHSLNFIVYTIESSGYYTCDALLKAGSTGAERQSRQG